MPPALPEPSAAKAELLLQQMTAIGSCAVAFSAGVDSTVVAQAAQRALGPATLAVTAVSDSLADGELELARSLAQQIGIAHVEISTRELQRPAYQRNAADRCYHCKTELYEQLAEVARQHGLATLVNGANQDDLGDYRPGLQAAAEFAVRSPLAECQLTKEEVRQLARHWGLPVWDKPATPCLASRIAYGEPVTAERMRRIDQAEQFLRQLGLRQVRVRLHAGELARIEAPLEALPELTDPVRRAAIAARFLELGFQFVTLDLQGFRSGSLNRLLGIGDRSG